MIIQDGLRRMVRRAGGRLLLHHPDERELPAPGACPRAREEGILNGMYLLAEARAGDKAPRVQLLGTGTILREVIAAAELLQDRLGRRRPTSGAARASTSCGATGWRPRAGTCCTREKPRVSCVEQWLAGRDGPVIAATDYMRAFADQIREFVPRRYRVLGTDGFGRSDSRKNLRALLRGRPPLRRGRGAEGARRRGRGAGREGRRGDQEVRHRRREAGAVDGLRERMAEIREVDGPRHRGLQGHSGHRGAVSAGRQREDDDSLVTLETDKATMEVPAPVAGMVAELKVKVGDKVSEGTPILTLEGDANGAQPRRQPAATPPRRPPSGRRAARARPPSAQAAARRRRAGRRRRSPPRRRDEAADAAHASPGVRRFARELGVDLRGGQGIRPQGPHPQGGHPGLRERRPPPRRASAAPRRRRRRPGPRRRGRRSTSPSSARSSAARCRASRRSRGPNLARNWVMIPHVTQFDEADITELEAFRSARQRGERQGGRQGDAARVPDEGGGRGAEEIPDVQHLARRRQPGPQALLPHRLRGRHAAAASWCR